MARIILDDLFFRDKRIERLASLCGESCLVTRSRLLQVFAFCFDQESAILFSEDIDIQAEWSGSESFADLMRRSRLANLGEDGKYRVCGIESRMAWYNERGEELRPLGADQLEQKRAAGRRSAEVRRAKYGSARPVGSGATEDDPRTGVQENVNETRTAVHTESAASGVGEDQAAGHSRTSVHKKPNERSDGGISAESRLALVANGSHASTATQSEAFREHSRTDSERTPNDCERTRTGDVSFVRVRESFVGRSDFVQGSFENGSENDLRSTRARRGFNLNIYPDPLNGEKINSLPSSSFLTRARASEEEPSAEADEVARWEPIFARYRDLGKTVPPKARISFLNAVTVEGWDVARVETALAILEANPWLRRATTSINAVFQLDHMSKQADIDRQRDIVELISRVRGGEVKTPEDVAKFAASRRLDAGSFLKVARPYLEKYLGWPSVANGTVEGLPHG